MDEKSGLLEIIRMGNSDCMIQEPFAFKQINWLGAAVMSQQSLATRLDLTVSCHPDLAYKNVLQIDA